MYDLAAIINKAAVMETSGISHNAAYIEAVKTLYPKDYSGLLAICREKGVNPETEIPALIDFLKNEQGIKTPAAKASPGPEAEKPVTQGAGGFDKLAEYARRSA